MRYRWRRTALSLAPALFVMAGCRDDSEKENAADPSMESIGRSVAESPVPSAPLPSRASAQQPNAAAKEVTIDNFAFSPRELTVPPGTSVTWLNRDDVPHTATDARKPRRFASGTLDTDDKFTHLFTAPGVYEYFCAVHPHMTGKIIVK